MASSAGWEGDAVRADVDPPQHLTREGRKAWYAARRRAEVAIARNARCEHGLERRVCMTCQHRFLRGGRGVYRYKVANRGLRLVLNRIPHLAGAAVVIGEYAYCVKWSA